eukprot:g30012.t1
MDRNGVDVEEPLDEELEEVLDEVAKSIQGTPFVPDCNTFAEEDLKIKKAVSSDFMGFGFEAWILTFTSGFASVAGPAPKTREKRQFELKTYMVLDQDKRIPSEKNENGEAILSMTEPDTSDNQAAAILAVPAGDKYVPSTRNRSKKRGSTFGRLFSGRQDFTDPEPDFNKAVHQFQAFKSVLLTLRDSAAGFQRAALEVAKFGASFQLPAAPILERNEIYSSLASKTLHQLKPWPGKVLNEVVLPMQRSVTGRLEELLKIMSKIETLLATREEVLPDLCKYKERLEKLEKQTGSEKYLQAQKEYHEVKRIFDQVNKPVLLDLLFIHAHRSEFLGIVYKDFVTLQTSFWVEGGNVFSQLNEEIKSLKDMPKQSQWSKLLQLSKQRDAPEQVTEVAPVARTGTGSLVANLPSVFDAAATNCNIATGVLPQVANGDASHLAVPRAPPSPPPSAPAPPRDPVQHEAVPSAPPPPRTLDVQQAPSAPGSPLPPPPSSPPRHSTGTPAVLHRANSTRTPQRPHSPSPPAPVDSPLPPPPTIIAEVVDVQAADFSNAQDSDAEEGELPPPPHGSPSPSSSPDKKAPVSYSLAKNQGAAPTSPLPPSPPPSGPRDYAALLARPLVSAFQTPVAVQTAPVTAPVVDLTARPAPPPPLSHRLAASRAPAPPSPPPPPLPPSSDDAVSPTYTKPPRPKRGNTGSKGGNPFA